MRLPISALIGRYEIAEWLGAGGMGDVYRARDPRLGRDVAVKLISEAGATDAARVKRFEHEAHITGQLNHPNVLAVFDAGSHAGTPYLVSELLEGETLRSRLQNGTIGLRKAVEYAGQIAAGLGAAHAKGVVHRDLKPENLFISLDGRVKILDFGVAKLLEPSGEGARATGSPTETLTGTIVGTATYMSPEQLRGETVDARSDVFSLGVVLFEMLTGRPPFTRPTAADTMAAVLKDDPGALETHIETPVHQVVMRCLEKDRELRFQSARDLTFALQCLSPTGDAPPARVRRTDGAGAWRRRTLLLVALVTAAVVGTGWLMLRMRGVPARENLLAGATITPLTNFEGSNLDAAISPDGTSVAFISDRDGPFHVLVTRCGSGIFNDLTPGVQDQRNPSGNRSVGFSGDGSHVWVSRTLDPPRPLRRIPVTGGAPRMFLTETAINVAWSPDGAGLAYFTSDPGDPIFVADGDGGNASRIYAGSSKEHNHFPAWSTDGEWIFFVHGLQPASSDVWRIRPSGGAPERLTHRNTEVRYLTAIDTRTVLFVAPDENAAGPWLWALDHEQRTTRRVSIGLERYLSVSSAANGRRLVATVARSSASLWRVPILDGLALERDLTPYGPPTVRALAPRFGRDSLFYLSSNGPGDGLWRVQGNTPEEIWKGLDGSLAESPSVSPRADRVAIVLRRDGRRQLNILPVAGAGRSSLAKSIDVRGTSAWSPDSKWIVTGGIDAQGPGLFKVAVAGGAHVRLVSGPAFDPVWSPADDLILYVGEQGALAPIKGITQDGTSVRVPEAFVPPGGGGHARFMPGGKAVVYLHGSPGMQDFWMMDLGTKRVRQLTRLPPRTPINTFDVTPDGRYIVFDRIREESDVRVIDLRK